MYHTKTDYLVIGILIYFSLVFFLVFPLQQMGNILNIL